MGMTMHGARAIVGVVRAAPQLLHRIGAVALVLLAGSAEAGPVLDLADALIGEGLTTRLHGHRGNGAFGVPVSAGADCDGDGHQDLAFSAMTASPLDRERAGEVYLFFGDGQLGDRVDTAQPKADLLRIFGDGEREATGSEIWMDDVTGDGVGDLLIARQNFVASGNRIGAGAVTILVGGSELRDFAATLQPLDLRNPPAELTLLTLVGRSSLDRLGIWLRSGDVSGDGVADLVIGADQENLPGGDDNGAVYLIRGGSHLAVNALVDLAQFGSTALAGHVARILPAAAPSTNNYHLGATVGVGDLDGNGRAEIIASAALNRVGASLTALGAPFGSAEARGGSSRGTLYIVWDENLPPTPDLWPAGLTLHLDDSALVLSAIGGGAGNTSFGEEVLAGFDVNGDGEAELFAGDIVGDLSGDGSRPGSGSGHLFYSAALLKGVVARRDLVPEAVHQVTFLGDERGAIAADTALVGDFDGDGFEDLSFSAPHQTVFGRAVAGLVYLFFGGEAEFPSRIDLRSLPADETMRIAQVAGARGRSGSDSGDTLAYSAVAADVDGDGRSDLVINEMEGNGVAEDAIDVGNLVVVAGGYASGIVQPAPCGQLPSLDCDQGPSAYGLLDIRDRDGSELDRIQWRLRSNLIPESGVFGEPVVEGDSYRLCIYQGENPDGPLLSTFLLGGASCDDRPCWRARGADGWRYRDVLGSRGGVRRLRVGRAGNGSLRIRVAARGGEIEVPSLPLPTPLTVELVRGGGVARACWQARFDTSYVSDVVRFKARTP